MVQIFTFRLCEFNRFQALIVNMSPNRDKNTIIAASLFSSALAMMVGRLDVDIFPCMQNVFIE